jgi:hypothetical protein
VTESEEGIIADLGAALDRMGEAQEGLREDFKELLDGFERLAAHLGPLLTRQYQDTQARMRVLETRVRTRQERPLIVRMAKLLGEIRRLESAGDIKAHVEDAMVEALTSAGYQEMGSVGEQFDPDRHEPVSGSVGRAGVVTHLHRRGLACHGDVIIKAMVHVEPAPLAEAGALPAGSDGGPEPAERDDGPAHEAQAEQEELPT